MFFPKQQEHVDHKSHNQDRRRLCGRFRRPETAEQEE